MDNRIIKYRWDIIKGFEFSKLLNRKCNSFYIFGSTVKGFSRKMWTPFSDIDIFIETKDESYKMSIRLEIIKIIQSLSDGQNIGYDLLWDEKVVNEELKQEILQNGVRII